MAVNVGKLILLCYNAGMIDLHIHTKYSDGEYNEEKIIKLIKYAGIKEFAICDHDTIVGSYKVYQKLKENNDKLIFHSGVEFSCRAKDYKTPFNCHLLVRDFDFNDEVINFLVKEGSNLRKQKIERMVEVIKLAYNIEIKQSEIDKVLKTTNSFGKPHMYKLLCNYGNFDREEYYACMDKLDTSELKLSAEKVLKLLKNSKANVTLAHPIEIKKEHNLKYIEIDHFVEYLKNLGLQGVEVYHSSHSEVDCLILEMVADSYKLFKTAGSDYHGPTVKPNVKLGQFSSKN